MPRPHFDASLIGELRNRVVNHNRAHPGSIAKFADAKRVYEKTFKGPEPHARALRKVDGYLADLAKAQFDGDEHPRGRDGEFSSKGSVSVPLPESEDDHRALQQSNAGYRALTTELLPTHRAETFGRIASTVAGFGTGALLVGSLLRGKPNGLAARAARGAGAVLGRKIGQSAGFGAHAVEEASAAARRLAGGETKATKWAKAFADKATKTGERLGRQAGHYAAVGGTKAVRGAVHMAGWGDISPSQRTKRRIGAAGALGVAAGLGVKHLIDSTVDPAGIGQSWDAYSYREIEKAASVEEAEAFRQQITPALRKGATIDDLAKIRFRPNGAVNAVRTGLAAVGGAAAGALAGIGISRAVNGRKGNPNHDAKGRFTSGSHAGIGGAVLGAATAGLGVYAALRSHNTKQLARVFAKQSERFASRLGRIQSKDGFGHVAKKIANRTNTAADMLKGDKPFAKEMRDRMADLGARGESHPDHYKEFIRRRTNDAIASHLHQIDEFEFPTGKGETTSVRDLRAKHKGDSTRVKSEIQDFAANAKPSEFHEALKSVSDHDARQKVADFFNSRQKWINGVDDQLSGHQAKLKELHDAAETTRNAEGKAEEAYDRASQAHDEHDETDKAGKRKKLTAMRKAEKDYDAAGQKHRDALNAIDQHLKSGAGVTLPAELGGGAVPRPDAAAMAQTRSRFYEEAHGKALEHVDADIQAARDKQVQDLLTRHARLTAAHAHMALGAGGTVPPGARAEAKAAAAAHESHVNADQRIVDATRNLAEARARHAAESLLSPPADQKGDHKKALSALATEIKTHTTALKNAHAAKANATVDTIKAYQKLERAMRVHGASPKAARVHPSVINRLRTDVMRGVRAGKTPVDKFLASGTAKSLANFASETKRIASATAKSAGRGIKATVKHAVLTPDEQGVSAQKVLGLIATGTAAGVIGAAAEHRSEARDALFGDEETRKKARPFTTPKGFQVEAPVDPIDGTGYLAVTVPDPNNKGERILVHGMHFRGPNDARPLALGSKLSDVRRRVAETKQQHQNYHQNSHVSGSSSSGSSGKRELQDVSNMVPETKTKIDAALSKLSGSADGFQQLQSGAAKMQFRSPGDKDHEEAAGAFLHHLRGKFLNTGSPSGAMVHHALDTLFSKQGRALKRRQAYRELTGYATDGNKAKGHSILQNREGFASSDGAVVAKALGDEVERITSEAPLQNDRQRGALHLAASVIGAEKNISNESMAAIHAKIRGQSGPVSPKVQAAASTSGSADAVPPAVDDPYDAPGVSSRMPSHFDGLTLSEHADVKTSQLANALKVTRDQDRDALLTTVHGLSRVLGNVHGEKMNERKAVDAAGDTILHMAGGGNANLNATMHAIKQGSYGEFKRTLKRKADEQLAKSASVIVLGEMLDDFEALAKGFSFDPSLHPRIPSGVGGGEFASEGTGSISGQLQQGVTEAPLDAGERAANQAALSGKGKSTPWYNPARVATEFGSTVAGDAAYKIAERFLPAPLRAAAQVADASGIGGKVGAIFGLGVKGAVKETVKAGARTAIPGVAGVASGVGSAEGINAAIGSQKINPPEYHDVGERLAETGGSLVGSLLGSIPGLPGGPAGVVAAGSVGSYAGGLLARGAYDWFKGYDQKQVKRVMSRVSPR